MNQWNGTGNLTKDPETRMAGEDTVCNFTLAVNRPFKNRSGERESDFIPVVVWGARAENCAKYLSKGKKVGITGRIQTRSYEADDGSRRYITEIVASEIEFLSPSNGSKQGGSSSGGYRPEVPDDIDEDLPF